MKKTYLTNRRFQNQRGLTLIEIVVALTLGLLVTATILQIFLSSKQAYRTQEQSSRIQESGSYALELLSKYIRMAGYRDLTEDSKEGVLIEKNDAFLSIISSDKIKDILTLCKETENFVNGQVITGSVKNSTSDCIIIRYKGSDDGSMTDCFGSNQGKDNQIINKNQTIINAFFVDTDKADGSALYCQSMVLNANGSKNESTPPQAFAPGIQNMKILYGVNAGDPKTGVQAYRTAGEVTDWNNVVSVKIALLVSSDNNITDKPQPYIFPPWSDNSITPEKDDFLLRRVFTTTINLRNQSQALYSRD